MSMDSETEANTGCGTCDDVNLANAGYGVLQMVACESNEVETIDEALALVERFAREESL